MRYWRQPLDAGEVRVPRGEVRIIADRCKGCGFCVEYCPKDVLVMSADFNRKGYHPPTAAHPEACIDCNLCAMICPEFAIFSVAVAEGDASTLAGAGAEKVAK